PLHDEVPDCRHLRIWRKANPRRCVRVPQTVRPQIQQLWNPPMYCSVAQGRHYWRPVSLTNTAKCCPGRVTIRRRRSRFSLLRRIFQYISKEHLERSRDEFSFRGNTRGLDDSEAAAIALADRGQAAHLQAADPTEWAATFPKKRYKPVSRFLWIAKNTTTGLLSATWTMRLTSTYRTKSVSGRSANPKSRN